jgi:hypothetical protein
MSSIERPRWERRVALLLFVVLGGLLVVRGIVPAVSRVDTDFPNYLTAAKIVADRGRVEQLYNDTWFQEQVRHYGTGKAEISKFAPFPPPTALLLLPLAGLASLDALRVMTAVSVLCLAVSIFLLARILSWSLIETSAFVLLSGFAVLNAFRFGQPYIVVSMTCVLGYYARLRGFPLLAGACFGLFVPIKYVPAVFLLYFAFRREWKLVLGGAASILLIAFLSISVLGWQIHQQFLASVLGNHLVGRLQMQDPFAAAFQSFDTLFRQLFVFDATSNPHPWLASPGLQIAGVVVTKAAILTTAVATLIRCGRADGENSVAPSVGLLGIVVLLLAPATATYHFVLLWLPAGLLIEYFLCNRAPLFASLMLGLYCLMGFIPYGHTFQFQGRGGLTVLAYPRLFLLLAMFCSCVYFIWSRPQPTAAAVPVGQ